MSGFTNLAKDHSVLALTKLRNQLTIRSNEAALTLQDERLLLAKNLLGASPGARDLFSIMDGTPQLSPSVMSLCLAILSSLLNLLSTHFIYHPLGEPIIKTLLSPSRMRQLNMNLTSASSDLILSTLKVFNSISTYAGNSYQRSVMDGFSWGQKSLHKLLFLRRKGKGAHEVDPVSKPDIRTLYIFFILSFLSTSTPTPIKLSLLEQHRDVFLLIFKGISQDPYGVVRHILEACWEGIWNDPKIKRTLKIGLFGEQTLNHILKLYPRDSPEGDRQTDIPADLVHHFMLALMTKPGVGICFRDRGWYPRETSSDEGGTKTVDAGGDEDEIPTSQGGKINNKILANIVKGLKVNEDPRQQELALKILEACPELVAGYWGGANLTLEPRLSSRWITNIAVFGTIISLPIPVHCFLLPHSTQHNPLPPPLSSSLGNILPSVLNKVHLTKGIQSPSKLVQHCTALALSKCLSKLYSVLTAFREAAKQLEEEEETGQWLKRSRELETEVERRVPDFMVIVAMVQQKYQVTSNEDYAKGALLTESALRLLWLYHRLFPRLVAEVRFDIGKLLLSVVDQPSTSSEDNGMEIDDKVPIYEGYHGMDVLRQIHVLRLLRESEQFAWSSKSGPSSGSYFHVILTFYTKTPHSAVRAATSGLLSHMLSSSILFSHDPSELVLWLEALPAAHRASHATGSDGTDTTGVLEFLDDCIQRCTKTPYRYLEENISLFTKTSSDESSPEDTFMQDDPKKSPSPLLMTLFEQLRAKIIANLISPSATLAVVIFMRNLIHGLTCKQPDLKPARKLLTKLEEICMLQNVAPAIQAAVRKECQLLSHILALIEEPNASISVEVDPKIHQLLEQVENLPTSSSVDSNSLSFELAYLHADPAQISKTGFTDILVSLFFSEAEWRKPFEYRLSIVMQRLATRMKRNDTTMLHPELPLLTSILNQARLRRTKDDLDDLKRIIFDSGPIRNLYYSPDISNTNFKELFTLVRDNLEPQSASDKALALEYCMYWAAYLKRVSNLTSCVSASPWIGFMEPAGVIQCLDIVISTVQSRYQLSETDSQAVVFMLDTLTRFQTTTVLLKDIQTRLHGLLDLRPCLDETSTLDALLLLIVDAGLPLGYSSLPLITDTSSTLLDVSLFSLKRWKNPATQLSLSSDVMMKFLLLDGWSETIARIISGAMYQSLAARHTFTIWLTQTEPHRGSSLGNVAIALHAYLDVNSLQGDGSVLQLLDPWFSALARSLISGQDSLEGQTLSASCIRMCLEASPSMRAHYVTHLTNEVRSASNRIVNFPCLLLFRGLHKMDATNFSVLFNEFSDLALRWMPNRLSEDALSADDLSFIEQLTPAISCQEVKPHLVEPILTAAIQSCLHRPQVIQSVVPLIFSSPLKPAVVNRVLQSIVQHSQLYRLTAISNPAREPIIRLLQTLFYRHPTNTCQPSHIVPLTRLYGGTLSLADRLLFSIFHLYEKQRKDSAASIFLHWSPSGSESLSQDALGAITNLEPSKVFRTCGAYPSRRGLDSSIVSENDQVGADTEYDPVFLTLLVAQLLAERKALSTVEWVQMFRSNVVSVVVCVLTSRDEALRTVGVSTLAGVLRRVQDADFLERDQVIYIMDMLRDLLPAPSVTQTPPPRLPTYPVMVLAHALRSTFYPSSFLYPIISRFLLQRPELDTEDVPMLYALLYSSADGGDWLRERTWMIRFLAEAIREGGVQDWTVLRRRHTWDLVASMWQAARPDERALRRGVLEFLANLSANPHAITSLILRSALLSWIELQLQMRIAYDAEITAFVKILENISITIDMDRANTATRGEFSAGLARCLGLVLRDIKVFDASALAIVNLTCRVLLRMATHPSSHVTTLSEILQDAVAVLQRIEQSIPWTTLPPSYLSSQAAVLRKPPHYARGLFDHLETENSLERWGDCVRALWRVSMVLDDRGCWDLLTCRLLVVRASSGVWGEGGSREDVGEWARKEAVACLLEGERG